MPPAPVPPEPPALPVRGRALSTNFSPRRSAAMLSSTEQPYEFWWCLASCERMLEKGGRRWCDSSHAARSTAASGSSSGGEPRESDGRYDPPSDPAWWRAQLAELAPVLNASAAEEKLSVLDAAYWRRFLGELKALV